MAADKLRNNMDAGEYKHTVLGLIFLKYISDAFEELHQKLIAGDGEYEGSDPEDADEYRAENVFWIPPEARWKHLQDNAEQPTIGKLIDDAMDAIERDNPRLNGTLTKDYARPALDKHRLGELIDLIGTIELGDKENRSKDILGRVYEYFLSSFASAEGKKGGQFYTPRCVVATLVEMLAPYKGRVYDPCCGSGGIFVQGEKFVEVHGGRIGDIRRAIIEADLVDCMVAMPGQLFYSTQIPVCLWFWTRDKSGVGFQPAKEGTKKFQELMDDGLLEIGDGYRAKNNELTGGGEILLRDGHVTDSHIDLEGVEHFASELTEKVAHKMSKVGDTIVTTKGNSTGRTSFVTERMPRFVYSPHLCYRRSADPTQIENGFIRYWARGREFHVQLAGLKGSTDMAPYRSLTDQRRLEITLPPIEEQRAIASILGALDDKIELNRRMNRALESGERTGLSAHRAIVRIGWNYHRSQRCVSRRPLLAKSVLRDRHIILSEAQRPVRLDGGVLRAT